MSLKTELRDQSLHFVAGFGATMFMVFFMSVNIYVAAFIVAAFAVGREIYQRLKKGDKWYDCGPGCRLDLLFWALGIGLAVALNLTGIDPLRGTASGVPGGGGGGETSLTPFDFSTGTKLFQTGFENNLILTDQTPSTQKASFSGIDNSVPVPNNYKAHFEGSGHLTDSRIYMQAGNSSDRFAEIVNSPKAGDGQGKVLHFQLSNAAIFRDGVPFKGRVQHSVSGVTGMKEIYFKTKMYLPPSMGNLRSFDGTLSWFTIAEFWNDQGSDPDPFRVTIAIHKPKAAVGSALRFSIHGQERVGTRWFPGEKWKKTNNTFAIPDDQWLTMEYYILDGGEPGSGAPEGRFVMVVTPEGESAQVIFDIKQTMRHSDIGTGGSHGGLNGFGAFQVHKLYCGTKEINHMKSQGLKLDVYFDDFVLWFQS